MTSETGAGRQAVGPVDTVSRNRRHRVHHSRSVWLFGYGSLIFKADFPWRERCPATIRGWVRRFWQGSHDHRGTPDAPGRVVTLIRQPGAVCTGMAYRVQGDVFEHLDVREKNGYLRLSARLAFASGGQAAGLVYIAGEDNGAFLGPAPEAEIARQIASAVGPSGPNLEYLRRLAAALRDLGADDPHVRAIEEHLPDGRDPGA